MHEPADATAAEDAVRSHQHAAQHSNAPASSAPHYYRERSTAYATGDAEVDGPKSPAGRAPRRPPAAGGKRKSSAATIAWP